MLGAAIIVFREVLEAALIVGIVLAASIGAPRRGLWVSYGVVAGIAGAGLVALFAGRIAAAASGIGQELLNATIPLLAVVSCCPTTDAPRRPLATGSRPPPPRHSAMLSGTPRRC